MTELTLEKEQAEVTLPPETSMRGDNTVYVGCNVVHCRQHYGICLFRLKAFDEDRVRETDMQDCARAIAGNYCEAKAMRKEEQDAGRALYYKQRIPVKTVNVEEKDDTETKGADKANPSFVRGWNSVPGKIAKDLPMPGRSTPPKKKYPAVGKPSPAKPESDLERGMKSVGGTADVINEIVSESKPEKTTKASALSPEEERRRKAIAAVAMMKKRSKK